MKIRFFLCPNLTNRRHHAIFDLLINNDSRLLMRNY